MIRAASVGLGKWSDDLAQAVVAGLSQVTVTLDQPSASTAIALISIR